MECQAVKLLQLVKMNEEENFHDFRVFHLTLTNKVSLDRHREVDKGVVFRPLQLLVDSLNITAALEMWPHLSNTQAVQ